MYLGENNGNLRWDKKIFFCQHSSQPFLKMRKFLRDMRKDFLIMSNFYLVKILSEQNSLTIVKKILKMRNYVLNLNIIFLITRIRNLQCVDFSNDSKMIHVSLLTPGYVPLLQDKHLNVQISSLKMEATFIFNWSGETGISSIWQETCTHIFVSSLVLTEEGHFSTFTFS